VDSTRLSNSRKLPADGPSPYSHTPNEEGVWHSLMVHLNNVASLTEEFAGAFGESALGYFIGLLHDIGKCNPDFQEYLSAQARGEYRARVPHAWGGTALAYLAKKQLPWTAICLPIAGHHSGLEEPGVLSKRLVSQIQKDPKLIDTFQKGFLAVIPRDRSRMSIQSRRVDRLEQEFKIRMLFSALIDADRLDTEQHFEKQKSELRKTWTTSMQLLWERFKTNQERLLASADRSTTVNQVRHEVYQACLEAAEQPQGLFRLTVPTGGGKTRSALAFGLRHALKHGLRRIIVVLPYTSIIDQTAKVYREILGENVVLEHHSQVNLSGFSSEGHNHSPALRYDLATENWDVPIIVTTTVQFFESLFSNHPSKCRKIHNIAGSVVILDEVQSLPTETLKPTLDAIRRLVEDYGVTVVLCTATQPALQSAPFLHELGGLRLLEIVPDYVRHFEFLKRVDYEIRHVEQALDSIASEIEPQSQCLVILNTRKEALELFSLVRERRKREEDVFHLSTLLCGAHRHNVIADITRRLKEKEPVCVVSTQVVEAGIDFDFPVVYRALGPLDRIVQAAGRCNREGKKKLGKVVVFRPGGTKSPRGSYAAGIEKARLLLERYPTEKLHDPDLYERYFQDLYYDLELDKYNLQEFRRDLNYPIVAERYRLIAGDTVCVVVPYGDAFTLLERWLAFPSRDSWRSLQPYLVSLYEHEASRLERDGWLSKPTENLYRWEGGYDNRRGIVEALYDPADLIS
jgi:CRISPR-associated endonuclease/helicase Cas3